MSKDTGFDCRQVPVDTVWTEVLFGYEGDPQKAAESFCDQFVLEGEPPFTVEVRDNYRQEITTWVVDKVMEPVYRARPKPGIAGNP